MFSLISRMSRHQANSGMRYSVWRCAVCIIAVCAVSISSLEIVYARPESFVPQGQIRQSLNSSSTSSIPTDLLGPDSVKEAKSYQQSGPCVSPANPIVAENCLPGTDNWIIKSLSNKIEGYAAPTSINIGETVRFYISTDAARFNLTIYRTGYYGGKGARLVKAVNDLAGGVQPDCSRDLQTGLSSCANWSSAYTLPIPADWVSGIYIGKLVRSDTGEENYSFFTVRDDNRKSDILYQQSYFTYQAYNRYGGKSVYHYMNDDDCVTVAQQPRAVKVSFFRPLYFDSVTLPESNSGNNYFRVEYSMVEWLEAQGYDVTYSTTLDTHRSGKPGAVNRLLNHHVFLSVGHDEYWTQEMRNAITAARDAGVHLGIFSANTSYWRVRLESDPLTNEPDSVMVVYKTTQSGASDPSGFPTTTWRDPTGVNDPENGLIGVQYIGDNDRASFPFRVTAEQGVDRMYRHTDLQRMPPNTYANIAEGIVGWEWDAIVDNGHTPKGLQILASSPVFGLLLQDAGNFQNANVGKAVANTTRYIAPSGAIVFATGTIFWSQGLGIQVGATHKPNPYISQITYNIFADMGVHPATPADTLVLDSTADAKMITGAVFLPQDAEKGPSFANINVTVTEDDQVTFTWETDTETSGWVWTGSRSGFVYGESIFSSTDLSRKHSITVTQSIASTIYYRIGALDQHSSISLSDERSFTTGGSFLAALRNSLALGSRVHAFICWANANRPIAIGVGVGGLGVVLIVTWRAVVFVQRRRRKRTITS